MNLQGIRVRHLAPLAVVAAAALAGCPTTSRLRRSEPMVATVTSHQRGSSDSAIGGETMSDEFDFGAFWRDVRRAEVVRRAARALARP